MPNKMLIDATHPEETRVVVLRGNRVEEFDFESANRKQLRGNIYLAKVTRVEPSLQAAFIDYGGNRHGFLAFSEIHPDYYQIPVADRQALIAEEERAQRAAEAEADQRAGRRQTRRELRSERRRSAIKSELIDDDTDTVLMAAGSEQLAPPAGWPDENEAPEMIVDKPAPAGVPEATVSPPAETAIQPGEVQPSYTNELLARAQQDQTDVQRTVESVTAEDDAREHQSEELTERTVPPDSIEGSPSALAPPGSNITEVNGEDAEGDEEEVIESVGGADALEEVPERTARLRRQYKIQEVIKRRQVMLVQVVKEERGTKGAALTTYLSLAGRYSVLMPNTARGGGISRKITSVEDRRRLKDIAQDLEVPDGMGVILRTAGATRTKPEVKRDFEYLMRLWETVRDYTLKSTAPTLVYEEGSLIKRSIRDLYGKDIEEIIVAGEQAHEEAKDFMRMLMPSHVKNVKRYRDTLPIFTRYGIESQLDAMFSPVMQLRSGGYIVLNQAEALVAIDVNSGRATREHHIEDTALKTNLEAAEEIARQLRLRDLAGLIVIDFIDMDEKRNNRAVERRLKECLRHDRARIQVGHISHFGLLEMSRQRIRSSVLESSTEKCAQCGGSGHVRSVSSVALQLLRSLEEMLLKGATHNLTVRTRTEIALYLLNNKRAHLRALEERFRISVMVTADATVGGQLSFVIEKGDQVHSLEQARALAQQQTPAAPSMIEAEEQVEAEESAAGARQEEDEEELVESESRGPWNDAAQPEGEYAQEAGRKRRRRRNRRGGDPRDRGALPADGASFQQPIAELLAEPREQDAEAEEALERGSGASLSTSAAGENGEAGRRRRRRGRRGGRRNRRVREEEPQVAFDTVAGSELEPADSVADLEAPPVAEQEQQPAPVPILDSSDAPTARAGESVAELQPAAAARPEQASSQSADPPVVAVTGSELPTTPQPPRRRSTVREPAPATLHGSIESTPVVPASTAEPVITGPADNASSGPRRSGWWSRRALGKG